MIYGLMLIYLLHKFSLQNIALIHKDKLHKKDLQISTSIMILEIYAELDLKVSNNYFFFGYFVLPFAH